MANEKKKAERFTSPIGVWKFPNLTKPSTKFKAEGVYDVTLRLSGEEAVAFEKKHAAALQAALEEGRKAYDELPVKSRAKIKFTPAETIGTAVYDEKTEEPTGEVEFKFKRTASGVSKKTGKPWSVTIPVYDSKGTILKGVEIWGGSEGRVSYELSPYFVPGTGAAGLSLRLLGAQVTSLVTKGAQSAASLGFDAVDDGYEYEPPAADSPEDQPETSAQGGDEDGADF